jgi:hypothetical protein
MKQEREREEGRPGETGILSLSLSYQSKNSKCLFHENISQNPSFNTKKNKLKTPSQTMYYKQTINK